MSAALVIPGPNPAIDIRQAIRVLPAPKADVLAALVADLLTRLTVPIARAARIIVEKRAWKESGWAVAKDWSSNELARDERWLRFAAALGRAIERWPQLAGAITGDDGERPVGTVAAVEIARVADDATIAAWIARARSMPVRALKDAVRSALALKDAGADDPPRVLVQLNVVREGVAAWTAARELHDAVSGRRTSVEEFVEALVAEFESGPIEVPKIEASLRTVLSRRTVEERERDAERFAQAERLGEEQEARELSLPETSRSELDELEQEVQRALGALGDGPESDLRNLLRAEELCRILLGRLLARLVEVRAWRSLGFASLGHYAEGRLGIGRRTASRLARIAREIRKIPELAEAYEKGRLGAEKTRLVLQRLAREQPEDERLVPDVIEAVRGQTCRRSVDENRVWSRASCGRRCGLPDSVRDARRGRPLSDEEWQSSLRRDPRAAYDEIVQLAKDAAVANAPVWIRFELRIQAGLAERFLACLDGATRQLERDGTTFSVENPSYAHSLGLLAMLMSFTTQWDPPAGRHPEGRPEVYRRDGYRCTAPGCTNRTGLHRHHLRYRSRGGDDSDANQTTLCAFHHQDGEHGGRMRVRGMAPLGLVFRLGPKERARWYRNDRIVR